MKKLFISCLTFILLLSLPACGSDQDSNKDNSSSTTQAHQHNWTDATCSAPKTCKDCGKTEGIKRSHQYENNICTLCGDKLPSKGLAYRLAEQEGTPYAAVVGMGECTDTDIVIEATYEGVPVTRIDPGAFSGSAITSVVIPDSVVSIGSEAFKGCQQLVQVKLGNRLESIDSDAFNYCSALAPMIIPASVTTMGSYVFDYCYQLTDIYCEIAAQPQGWNYWWNDTDATVHWGIDDSWEITEGVRSPCAFPPRAPVHLQILLQK